MLNKRELSGVVKYFRICSIVVPLPVDVDLVTWQLKKSSWIGKYCICLISYSFFVLHALYKIASLAYANFYRPHTQLHQLVVHANIAMASAVFAVWYFQVYIADLELFIAYVNVTLLGNIRGPPSELVQPKKHWTTRMREYTVQDLLAISVPYMIMLAILFVSASFVYDPSMSVLLYSALPRHLQTWATFGLCLLEEVRFLLTFTTIATPIWQLQVISYDLVTSRLQLLSRMIQNGTRSPRCAYLYLCSLQLYVSLMNDVNNFLIFTWKVMCISMSILSGYAAIAHFNKYPLFGVMYYLTLFNSSLIYTIIYGKAFKIPQLFDHAAGCALLHTRRDHIHVVRRQILSIPPMV